MKKCISGLIVLCLVFSSVFSFSSCNASILTRYDVKYFDYFDTVTTIIGWEESQEDFNKVCREIKTELDFYNKLYTIYLSFDDVNNACTINQLTDGAHNVVEVDEALIDLLSFCKEMYNKTNGKVNIAMGSVLSIWHKYRENGKKNPEKATLPDINELKSASENTDINDIIIDEENNTVFLNDPNMTLDLGAIAKGYAVEKVAEYLISKGITGYCLNVGGNTRVIGDSNGDPWKVGIEDPSGNDDYVEILNIQNKSVVTSGNYQRFYKVKGKNYHHIIDPETLMPGEKYTSVSIVTEDSGYADALSTMLFLTDFEEGFEFVENTDDLEALWILPDGEVKYSSGFKNYIG